MASPGHKLKIVVSYRRTDAAMAGRIFDRLALRFGADSIFLDIDNIPFGIDFRKHIEEELEVCDLVIAIIGPDWIGARGGGEARIMNDTDPVRVEVETALRRDITVIPVLLDDAKMPQPEQLPESLKDFAYRNALEVESGRDFNVHVERLIKAVERALGSKCPDRLTGPAKPQDKKGRPSSRALALVLGGVALIAAIAALAYFGEGILKDSGESGQTIVLTGDAANECSDLKAVAAEASTNFVKLRTGEPIKFSFTEEFDTTTPIAGYESCVVSVRSAATVYVCTTSMVETKSAGEELLKAKTETMTNCLKGSGRLGSSTPSKSSFYLSGGQTALLTLSTRSIDAGAGKEAMTNYYLTLQIWQSTIGRAN